MVNGVPGGCAYGLNGLRAFCGAPVFKPNPLPAADPVLPPLTLLELIGGGGTGTTTNCGVPKMGRVVGET